MRNHLKEWFINFKEKYKKISKNRVAGKWISDFGARFKIAFLKDKEVIILFIDILQEEGKSDFSDISIKKMSCINGFEIKMVSEKGLEPP